MRVVYAATGVAVLGVGSTLAVQLHVQPLALRMIVALCMSALVALTAFVAWTAWRRAQALRQEERKFRLLFEQASDAHVILADNGIVDCNNAALRLLACEDKKTLIGLQPSILSPELQPDGRRSVEKAVELVRTARRDGSLRFEWIHRTVDGREFPAEVTLTPVVLAHRPVLLVVLHDLSERNRREQALRAAKEAAEEAARVKSEFVARVSHELRTPMNGVLGMTELVLRTSLTDEQRDCIETVRVSATHLLGIINDILDFSRSEARHLELEARPFRLRDDLGEILKTLSAQAYQKGIDLMFSVDSDVPDRLVGDVHRLRQVIVNLVGNALKFTERGEIVVSVSVEAGTESAWTLRFCVADTGCGIAEDQHARIFESFAQAKGQSAAHYGGTGLGLAISAQLVALMGGRIWVESEVGKGSRFLFTAQLHSDLAKTVPEARPRLLEKLSVLVIAASARHRLILQQMLGSWQLRARVVPDAEHALSVLRRAHETDVPVDLVIADLTPGAEAESLCAGLAGDPGLRATPILWLISAPSECPSTGEGLRSGWVMKPVLSSPLLEKIEELVHGTERARTHEVAPGLPRAARPLRVLVADDNPINRNVSTRILELAGHTVVAVEDGARVLELLDQSSFDVVLMDVQMPVMDGFEATRLLREREAASGRHTRVVAVTAQAMGEDRARCLAAGMDGYVTKPLSPTSLLGVLEAQEEAKEEAPFDEAGQLELVAGNRALLAEMVRMYREDAPELLSALTSAVERREGPEVVQLAHRLKGTLLNLAAGPAARAAAELEALSRQGALERVSTSFEALMSELSRLDRGLRLPVSDG